MWYDTCVTDSDENETASRLRRFGARAWRTALCRCMRTRTAPLLCGDRRMEGSDGPGPVAERAEDCLLSGAGAAFACRRGVGAGRCGRSFFWRRIVTICVFLARTGCSPLCRSGPGLARASPSAGLSPRGVRAPKMLMKGRMEIAKERFFLRLCRQGGLAGRRRPAASR